MTTNLKSDIRVLAQDEIEHVAGGSLAATMAAATEGGLLNGNATCKDTMTSDGFYRVFTAAGFGYLCFY